MNNKGFTLIELIVTITILTIISGAILGFIYTGTTSFGKVSDDAGLQNEAQISFNQIGDLIIDSTNGIKLFYNDDKVYLDNSEIANPGSVTSKTLAIYNSVDEKTSVEGKDVIVNKQYVYNVIWEKSDKKLYLRKDEVINLKEGTVKKGEKSLMSEYVTDFSPSLSKVSKKNKMTISMSFNRNKASYSTVKTFSLRNKAVVNGSLTEIYDGIMSDISEVTSVEITQNGLKVDNVTLWKKTKEISFGKKIIGIGYPSNEVEWTLTGSSSEDSGTRVETTSTGCKVILGDKETSGSLALVATSKQVKDGKVPVSSDPVTISIKEITGISLGVEDHENKFYKNQVFGIRADVSSIGTLNEEEKKLEWSITGATRDTGYSEDGLYQKLTITAKPGEKIIISVKSKSDNEIVKVEEIDVSAPEYAVSLKTDNNAKMLFRGSSLRVTADISPNDGEQGELVWNVVAKDGGSEIDIGNYMSIDYTQGSCTISVSDNLPNDKSYDVYVSASLPDYEVKSLMKLMIPKENATIEIIGPDTIYAMYGTSMYKAVVKEGDTIIDADVEWILETYHDGLLFDGAGNVTHTVNANEYTIHGNTFYYTNSMVLVANCNINGKVITARKTITVITNQ